MKVSKEVIKGFYEVHEWHFPNFDFERGLVFRFKEKHGERLFDASTLEMAGKACLKILAERHKEYSYYDCDEQPESPAVPKEQAEALPESRAKDIALDEWKAYENRTKEYERSKRFHNAVVQALKDKDHMLAIALVFTRREYEYEGVEEEYLEEVG